MNAKAATVILWLMVLGVWFRLLETHTEPPARLVSDSGHLFESSRRIITTTTTQPPVTTTTTPPPVKAQKPVSTPKPKPKPVRSNPVTSSPCEQAIARSITPLAPGWVERCTPRPEGPRGGGLAVFESKTIYYDAVELNRKGEEWGQAKSMWDFVVSHERCHSLYTATTATLADPVARLEYERSTDRCAKRYGVDTRWSPY